ncbi:1,4-dihydroxy-2-naphthoate octaprenyltransferase [Robertkochia marina]|uniref:1,4-dihydroxy-2-naphthoate octaprenyltransferase n=1 Tax=Robertkochia marina TaxID=1227945 RepID=A0A4S3M0A9_9FLAO|nr:1,4-dihydroxy-2-naphthoate octaprenyltransferase [Robertkochia marina]THD67771.1 1,4-dihydroxy-2-naphthoate octaprenyltransferase [Robertkochia marina]TRZ40936.1 1,4-dihydroxy-2-naphthoate octaprenyltransferase [Robertkochia marina]
MSNIKAFVSAARLRTLPLSLSGIVAGTGMAASEGLFDPAVFTLALITTIGLQVLSNFANDYGDGVKGTDNDERVGPQRALQSGLITPAAMKKAVIMTALITLFTAVALIFAAFGSDRFYYSLLFFLLGVAAIAAAIKYTVGDSAYGYRGLGDVFVFIFFGLVSVVGSYFLYTKELSVTAWLPGISIGFLSVGVLNLNNLRDRKSDQKSGKNTLVVILGSRKARIYHNSLIILAMVFSLIYLGVNYQSPVNLLWLLSFLPLAFHLKRFNQTKEDEAVDPELKKLAISTFVFSVLFFISFNIFL